VKVRTCLIKFLMQYLIGLFFSTITYYWHIFGLCFVIYGMMNGGGRGQI
jgi:hypothetical protein